MGLTNSVSDDTRTSTESVSSTPKPIATPTLLGMILCAMIGWVPLLIIPPAIASVVAWRDRNLPALFLAVALTVAAALLAVVLVAVLRSPFI